MMRHLLDRTIGRLRGSAAAAPAEVSTNDVLDAYCKSVPSPQNAIDIFKGQWSSRFPSPLANLQAGSADLFDDARIRWLEQELGGLSGKTVLELGPLEAGHTYMLERMGAAGIVAVEANTRAYLKCLVAKELLGIGRARFLCGDFIEYLKAPGERFDLGVASGVLYHMTDPVQLLSLLSARCGSALMLWTHYYDESIIRASPALGAKFTSVADAEVAGFRHRLFRQEYRQALSWAGFCGGSSEYSNWLNRDDLLASLRHLGFDRIRTAFDHPEHPNGPAIALLATR